MDQLDQTICDVKLPAFYLEKNAKESGPVILLMHGYQQNASNYYRKLKSALPDDIHTISLCAPYLIPLPPKPQTHEANGGQSSQSQKTRVGFSWYFFDRKNSSYVIDYEPAKTYFKSFLKNQNLHKRKLWLIGYSQGGYMLNHLLADNKNIEFALGINCKYRTSEITINHIKRVSQIHGELDTVVNGQEANELFQNLKSHSKVNGEFQSIKNATHEISEDILKAVKGEIDGWKKINS